MTMKPVAMLNLSDLKKTHPSVYEDIVKLQQSHNELIRQLGGLADPIAAGGIVVSGANGIIDVQIIDKHPEVGEEYFLEYDTQPSFAAAHGLSLGAVRNYRSGNLAGITTYWRWYKSTKLGGLSAKITFGNPPTAVTPGQLSTASSGPALSSSQGSGQSQIPGYGYSASDRIADRQIRSK